MTKKKTGTAKKRTHVRTVHHHKPAPTHRRRSRKSSKGMLSELFNPNMAQGAIKSVVSGAIGGAVAGYGDKMLPADWNPMAKAGIIAAGGFVAATMLKMPNIGAGMAGVAMYKLMESQGMLGEEYDYANPIESLPVVLNEDGAHYLSANYDLAEGLYEDAVPYYNYDTGWSVNY